MQCSACRHGNPPDATFCDECGVRLEAACSACGEANRASTKFCRKCGQPLTQAVAAAPAAKFTSPQLYTPKLLAERILTAKAALEGERTQETPAEPAAVTGCVSAPPILRAVNGTLPERM